MGLSTPLEAGESITRVVKQVLSDRPAIVGLANALLEDTMIEPQLTGLKCSRAGTFVESIRTESQSDEIFPSTYVIARLGAHNVTSVLNSVATRAGV